MPTTHHAFATPEPVTLRLLSNRGTVTIVATDTAETTVDISGPRADPLVRVEASRDGRSITVEPRRRIGIHDRLDITVHLPTGSTLDVQTAAADVAVQGVVAAVHVHTASAGVRVEHVQGVIDAKTASGSVHLGTAGGPVEFRSASGSLRIDAAEGDISATTVSGRIDVREAHRGALDLRATSGGIDVGVRRGTLVWFEVSSVSGRVQSNLQDEQPGHDPHAAPLSVRARTVSGPISFTSVGASAIAL